VIEHSVDPLRRPHNVLTMRSRGAWHDPRTFLNAPLRRMLLVGALCAWPSAASAQPWSDAYKSGDYQKAADLLHPLVLQQSQDNDYAEPEPAQRLATMYELGLGVPRDPILACALANFATRAVQNLAPRYAYDFAGFKAREAASDAYVHKQCATLSEQDGFTAGQSMGGCWGFGVRPDLFTVGSVMVRLDHRGIRLANAPERGFEADSVCLAIIARVRPFTIDPPTDAAPGVGRRHFVEVLGWSAGTYEGRRPMTYVLQWQIYELQGKTIVPLATQQFDEIRQWPKPAVPFDFDARLTFEMIRSGHVRWKLDGAPPRRGWIMLPGEDAR
jgi:hypothetical protein